MGEVSARLGQARYAHYGSARLGQTAADEVLVECHRQPQRAQRHGRLPQVGQLKSNLEPTPRTTAPRSDHSPHAHRAVTGRVAAAPLAHQLHRPRVLPQRTAVAAATAAAAAELGELPTRPALLRAHRARTDGAAGRTPRNLRGGDCAGEWRRWLSDEGCRRVLLRLQAWKEISPRCVKPSAVRSRNFPRPRLISGSVSGKVYERPGSAPSP